MIRGRPDLCEVLSLDRAFVKKTNVCGKGNSAHTARGFHLEPCRFPSAGVLTNEPPDGFAHSDVYLISLVARSFKGPLRS